MSKIQFMEDSTIKWKLHNKNWITAKRPKILYFVKKIRFYGPIWNHKKLSLISRRKMKETKIFLHSFSACIFWFNLFQFFRTISILLFSSILESFFVSVYTGKKNNTYLNLLFSRKKKKRKNLNPMAINIECILSQLIAAREPSKRVTKKKKTKCYHSTEAIVTCLAFFSFFQITNLISFSKKKIRHRMWGRDGESTEWYNNASTHIHAHGQRNQHTHMRKFHYFLFCTFEKIKK